MEYKGIGVAAGGSFQPRIGEKKNCHGFTRINTDIIKRDAKGAKNLTAKDAKKDKK